MTGERSHQNLTSDMMGDGGLGYFWAFLLWAWDKQDVNSTEMNDTMENKRGKVLSPPRQLGFSCLCVLVA